MKDTMATIREFIDAATRSRKYPENTGIALKVALRLFETELNQEEKSSIDIFKANLDKIYQAVFEKNKTKYSAGSLNTYRKRVSKVLNDYFTYGTDPAKMNSWNPPTRKVTPSTKSTKKSTTKPTVDDGDLDDNLEAGSNLGARLDWPLANGRKAILVLPADLTAAEAKTIQDLVALRVSKVSADLDS